MSDFESLRKESEMLLSILFEKTEQALRYTTAQRPDMAELRTFALKSIVKIKKQLTKLEKELKKYEEI